MKIKILIATLILSIMILMSACNGVTVPNTTDMLAENAVKVEFYVMSQCPYGTQVEDAIAPVLEKLGNNIDFHLDFIVSPQGEGFRSLHGQPEVDGNIAQLCAIEHEPANYMNMITCMNKNARSIPDNWESCAEENEMDVATLKTCYEGEEGKGLLTESMAKAQARQATGSPTIYINDAKYSGARGETDFMKAICNVYEEEKPLTCDDIPEDVPVNAVVLSDKRCLTASCNTANVESQLRGVFPAIKYTKLDYSSDEGKALFEELNLGALPAVLFEAEVTEAPGYSSIQQFVTPAGEYYSLRIGAAFDPTKEICDNEVDDTDNGLVDCDDPDCVDSIVCKEVCDNGIDDTGNGLVDCADPDCTNSLECREEIDNNLMVFIMSDCPYGRKAVEALYEVVGNFGDALEYEVHYIAREQGDGFQSLHGQYEVDENIIQLCVFEHSPDSWLEYINCRSTNGVKNVEWTTCAEDNDVDVDAVQACFDGDEGAGLLREDIKIANDLGVSASPTWFANNKYKFGGIDGEKVKTEFCKYNDVEGCGNTLSGQAQSAGGSC